jgi:hypothetical protein
LDGLLGVDPGSDTSSEEDNGGGGGRGGVVAHGKRVLRHALTQARDSSRKSGKAGPGSSGAKSSQKTSFMSMFKKAIDAAPRIKPDRKPPAAGR